MAKDALVNKDLAAKFATEKDSPYTRWVADEGLDIIAAHYVPDLKEVELKPWARRGGRGVFINHEASRTSNDCYVAEIPAGGELAPQRQLFEEMILVLSGHGSTKVWNDSGAEVTFEWGPGALFAIPLNANHQHFNGSGTETARFVVVDQRPGDHQPLRRHRLRVRHRARLPEALQRRAGLLRAQGRAEGSAARHQLRGRLDQPAADRGQGARRRRRAHPLQHGQGLDEQPHLAVPDGHVQEGPPPRPGRARDHPVRRGLQPHVARGRGAHALRVAARAR